jgi:methionyl-tRNA formyltransferase
MKCIFLGCTDFSMEMLITLLKSDIRVSAIFSIPEYFTISYSDKEVRNYKFADLSQIADSNQIPLYWVDSKKGMNLTDYNPIIKKINPDLILVLGWYYKVLKSTCDLARYGAWGIHASLLPRYAGGAPLVWAMINGEKEAGVTLFKLDDGVDNGDIIDQKSFLIEEDETIKEVLEKSLISSKEILIKNLKDPESIQYKKQDITKTEIYPQRKPEDGEIDLSWSAEKIYNFIRAQSAPYPGAFIRTSDGKKIIIDKAKIA